MERHSIDSDAVAQRYRYNRGLSSVGDRGDQIFPRRTEYFGNIWSGGPNISDIFGPAGPEIGGTDYAVTGLYGRLSVNSRTLRRIFGSLWCLALYLLYNISIFIAVCIVE